MNPRCRHYEWKRLPGTDASDGDEAWVCARCGQPFVRLPGEPPPSGNGPLLHGQAHFSDHRPVVAS